MYYLFLSCFPSHILPPCLPVSLSHLETISVHVHNSLHIPPALTYTGPVDNPALPSYPNTGWLPTNPPFPLAACSRDAESIACLDVLLLWPTIHCIGISGVCRGSSTHSPPYYPLYRLPNHRLTRKLCPVNARCLIRTCSHSTRTPVSPFIRNHLLAPPTA